MRDSRAWRGSRDTTSRYKLASHNTTLSKPILWISRDRWLTRESNSWHGLQIRARGGDRHETESRASEGDSPALDGNINNLLLLQELWGVALVRLIPHSLCQLQTLLKRNIDSDRPEILYLDI